MSQYSHQSLIQLQWLTVIYSTCQVKWGICEKVFLAASVWGKELMSDTVIYSECSKQQVSVSHIWFVLSMSDLQDSSSSES